MNDRRIKTLKTCYAVMREKHPHLKALELVSTYENVKLDELIKLIPNPDPVRTSERR